jgi:hypothetical protein
MKIETRSVWDYGLVGPKSIGRPALYVWPASEHCLRSKVFCYCNGFNLCNSFNLCFFLNRLLRYAMLRAGYVQCLEVSKGAEVTNSKK